MQSGHVYTNAYTRRMSSYADTMSFAAATASFAAGKLSRPVMDGSREFYCQKCKKHIDHHTVNSVNSSSAAARRFL